VAKTKAPEKIAPEVYRIDAVGFPNAISVLLLEGDDGFTLVDTGLGSSAGRIWEALSSLGGGTEDLKRIYLTHHHTDHIGGLPGVREWAPGAELIASECEAEIISGRRELDERPNPIIRFLDRNAKLPRAPVSHTVREGDTVGGFRVISTPGSHPRSYLAPARRGRPLVHRRCVRGPGDQDPGRRQEVLLHGPSAGETLRREAAPGGVRHRSHEPRQANVRRRPPKAWRGSRPLQLCVGAHPRVVFGFEGRPYPS
jgi:hypothetical protein